MHALGILFGVLIGGFVAWHLKLAHVSWADWRFAAARMKRTRKLFWRHAGRGLLITVGAAVLLWMVTR